MGCEAAFAGRVVLAQGRTDGYGRRGEAGVGPGVPGGAAAGRGGKEGRLPLGLGGADGGERE